MANGLPQYAPTNVDVTASPDQMQPMDASGAMANAMIPPEQQPQWNTPALTGMTTSPLTDPALQAAAVHHTRLADSIRQTAAEMLHGGSGQQLQIFQNPDGSVSVQPQAMTTGQKWGRIAAAALSGAAQGYAVGTGPGGAGRAAGAGLAAGMQIGQGNQDQTLQLAEQMNKQNRDAQLFKANMALMNQRIAQGSWQAHRNEITALEGEEDRNNQIATTMRAAGAEDIHIDSEGNPDTLSERLSNLVNSRPDWVRAHANGQVQMFTTYGKDGKPNGMDAYLVPEDKLKQPNKQAYQPMRAVLNDDGTATMQPYGDPIQANSMSTEQLMAIQQHDTDQQTKVKELSIQQKGQLAQAKVGLMQAQAAAATERAAAATAAAANREKFTLTAVQDATGQTHYVEMGDRGTVRAPQGPAAAQLEGATVSKIGAGGPASDLKTQQYLDKQYISKARDTENSADLFDQAFQEYQHGAKTGAPAMVAFSKHIQSTFGSVKGARINKDMIAEHFGARSISDDLLTAVQKLTTGNKLSDNQWREFGQLIHGQRDENWRQASDAALSFNYDPNRFLPGRLKNSTIARGYQGPAAAGAPAGNISQAARQPGPPAPPTKGNVSMAKAMTLPGNAGKTQQQVMTELTNLGYTPVP